MAVRGRLLLPKVWQLESEKGMTVAKKKKATEAEITAACVSLGEKLREFGGLHTLAVVAKGESLAEIASRLGLTPRVTGLGFRALAFGGLGGLGAWSTRTRIIDKNLGIVTSITVTDDKDPEKVTVKFGASTKRKEK